MTLRWNLNLEMPMSAAVQFMPFETLNGQNVFVRTVTLYHVGTLQGVEIIGGIAFLVLNDVTWVANTERFHRTTFKGELKEVEPWPNGDIVRVSLASVVDVWEWKFPLPRNPLPNENT